LKRVLRKETGNRDAIRSLRSLTSPYVSSFFGCQPLLKKEPNAGMDVRFMMLYFYMAKLQKNIFSHILLNILL